MLGSEDDVLGPGATKDLCPGIGIPFLNLAIKGRSKVVVIVISAIGFTMVSLGRRALQSHGVQVPLCIRILSNVVLRCEIVLRVDERGPTRNRVKTPMYKYP